MKKIARKNVYECTSCKNKIVGYTTTCPICKSVVQKINEKIIVTMKK